jgi:hypothetical protein
MINPLSLFRVLDLATLQAQNLPRVERQSRVRVERNRRHATANPAPQTGNKVMRTILSVFGY